MTACKACLARAPALFALLMFPMAAVLGILAQALVHVLLGNQWGETALVVPIVGGAVAFGFVQHLPAVMCEVRGRLRQKLAIQSAYLMVLVVLVALVVHRDPTLRTLAVVFLVGQVLQDVLYTGYTKRDLSLSAGDILVIRGEALCLPVALAAELGRSMPLSSCLLALPFRRRLRRRPIWVNAVLLQGPSCSPCHRRARPADQDTCAGRRGGPQREVVEMSSPPRHDRPSRSTAKSAVVHCRNGVFRRVPIVQRSLRRLASHGLIGRHVWSKVQPVGLQWVPCPGGGGFLYDAAARDVLARSFIWTGFRDWESTTVPLFCEFARRSTGFLDVGTFTGVYSLLACSVNPSHPRRRSGAQSLCSASLRRNIDVNRFGERCTPLPVPCPMHPAPRSSPSPWTPPQRRSATP